MPTSNKLALAVCALLTGCATTQYGSMVDPYAPGYDHARYLQDKAQCIEIANQRPASDAAGNGALGGLVIGTLFGAIVGSSYGETGSGAAYGAALGTASGAASGAANGAQVYAHIVRECLRGRGYRVLD